MPGESDVRFAAHLRENDRQSLNDHLHNVACFSSRFAAKFGAADLGYWAGMWHDLGKFNPAFQAYLSTAIDDHGPDHKAAGAVLALKHCSPLCFVIAGHHGGLPSLAQLKSWLSRKRHDPVVQETLWTAAAEGADLNPKGDLKFPQWLTGAAEHQVELFIRMLFSALVDADYLDTAAFMQPEVAASRFQVPALWETLRKNSSLRSGATDPTALDPEPAARRQREKERCCSAGRLPQGVFYLNAATGAFVTPLTLDFALSHVLHHHLDRILFAVHPAVLREKMVQVYRSLGVWYPDFQLPFPLAAGREAPRYINLRASLASENWEAPVIVASMETIFQSLCSNLPWICRKLHNLSRSVLVIDDSDEIPKGLIDPIQDLLQELIEHYQVSLVFAGAEQPAWPKSPGTRKSAAVRSILPSRRRVRRIARMFEVLQGALDWQRVAAEALSVPQSIVVTNTKRDALLLFAELKGGASFHLSSLMCQAHRQDIIGQIKNLLDSGRPCHLVSTQLAQFKRSVSFPMVLCAIAPLEMLLRLATRIHYGASRTGRLIVFDPSEGRLPQGSYASATVITKNLLRSAGPDASPSQLTQQYSARIRATVDTDSRALRRLREEFDFPTMARRFSFREFDTRPVVVPYAPPGKNRSPIMPLLERVIAGYESHRDLGRLVSGYVVEIYPTKLEQSLKRGLARQVMPGLWQWLGRYDPQTGIVLDDLQALGPENQQGTAYAKAA